MCCAGAVGTLERCERSASAVVCGCVDQGDGRVHDAVPRTVLAAMFLVSFNHLDPVGDGCRDELLMNAVDRNTA